MNDQVVTFKRKKTEKIVKIKVKAAESDFVSVAKKISECLRNLKVL